MQKAIEAKNLTKEFQIYHKPVGLKQSVKSLFKRDYSTLTAVDNINISIEEGELIGFIGVNGAGKTTTLKMLSGLLHPTNGEVKVLGYEPYKRDHSFLKNISLVLGQKAQLWWELPAVETFHLNKVIFDIPERDFNKRLDLLVDLLEVKDIIEVQVRKLSLGQRMKCELIAAILHDPKIMFLDEPTIGLDILSQKKIRKFLKEYNQKFNTTIILTSHNMDDVKEVCNRLIIIDKGKILFDDSIVQLTRKFADTKNLKIVFNQEIFKEDMNKYGEVTEINENSCTIKVSLAEHTKIASSILSKFDVDDLDIQEISMNEIISNIFSDAK